MTSISNFSNTRILPQRQHPATSLTNHSNHKQASIRFGMDDDDRDSAAKRRELISAADQRDLERYTAMAALNKQRRNLTLQGRLLNAAESNSPSEVIKVLDELPIDPTERAKIINQSDEENRTPLHLAASGRTLWIVKLLLENGAQASLNVKDSWGRTPLHHVASEGTLEILKLLLENSAQASVNVKDRFGQTPLHRAQAAWNESLDRVKLLLENGAQASVNVKDNQGRTPLHRVHETWIGTLECVKLLLENGAQASVNEQDAQGRTPLHEAVAKGPKYVKLLLENGAQASVNVKDNQGRTPLHLAARGDQEIAQLLLENGAKDSLNVKDNQGRTPLHEAARGRRESVKLLLENGAKDSVNEQDDQGRTPLHVATGSAEGQERVKLLLENGAQASLNVGDKQGMTPLMWLERSAQDMARIFTKSYYVKAGILLAYGAKPEELSDAYRQEVITYLDTMRNISSDALVNPEATPKQLEQASEWFQLFPPNGGELKWNLESTTKQCNAFLDTKQSSFFEVKEVEKDEKQAEQQQAAILKHVHPIFESGLASTDSLVRLAFKQLAAAFHQHEEQH